MSLKRGSPKRPGYLAQVVYADSVTAVPPQRTEVSHRPVAVEKCVVSSCATAGGPCDLPVHIDRVPRTFTATPESQIPHRSVRIKESTCIAEAGNLASIIDPVEHTEPATEERSEIHWETSLP